MMQKMHFRLPHRKKQEWLEIKVALPALGRYWFYVGKE
jgi:hypothetical protein